MIVSTWVTWELLKDLLIPLFIYEGVAIGSMIILCYWDDLVEWVKKSFINIKTLLKNSEIVGYSRKLFAYMKDKSMRLVLKVYFKLKNGKWRKPPEDELPMVEISESEVPEWAKEGLTDKEIDVTERYKKELELSL